jgi:hypothetical protein
MPSRLASLTVGGAAVLLLSAMLTGGCASSSSNDWSQTAPSIRPARETSRFVSLVQRAEEPSGHAARVDRALP